MKEVQLAAGVVSALPSRSAAAMAVTGRQKSRALTTRPRRAAMRRRYGSALRSLAGGGQIFGARGLTREDDEPIRLDADIYELVPLRRLHLVVLAQRRPLHHRALFVHAALRRFHRLRLIAVEQRARAAEHAQQPWAALPRRPAARYRLALESARTAGQQQALTGSSPPP